jgi:hypothetical protein
MRLLPASPALKTSLLLLLVYTGALLPFRHTSLLGERDSYRMLLGLVDGASRAAFFESPLLYNREVSFGYYAFIRLLTGWGDAGAAGLVSAMNLFSTVSAILLSIPFFLVVRSVFTPFVAVASSLLLLATPVFWSVSLYGHPIMPALLLFFTALALIAAETPRPAALRHCLVILLLGVSLTFRFDLVLMLPLVWSVLDKPVPGKALSPWILTPLYSASALLLFFLAQSFLPLIQGDGRPPSLIELLIRIHQPSNLLRSLRELVISTGQGLNLFFWALLPVGLLVILRKGTRPQFVFTALTFAGGFVFYLPIPYPARHYLTVVPSFAVMVAIACIHLSGAFRLTREFSAWRIGGVMGGAGVLASLVIPTLSAHFGYFLSPFSVRASQELMAVQHARFAQDLVRRPKEKERVLVLCDSNLVVANMHLLAPGVSARLFYVPLGDRRVGFHEVRFQGNVYIMLEQSWEPEQVRAAFDQGFLYPDLPILANPYGGLLYDGPRRQIKIQSP